MKTLKLLRWSTLNVVFLLIPLFSSAQGSLSFAQIDSLSYKAYLDSDWKKVLTYTKAGLNSGIDYYYLRMRAGLAELNRKRPVKAIPHYRKALEFNEKDPGALEFLYSSLLFSGNLAESRLLAADYSPEFRKQLGIPARRLITGAFLEPGYMAESNAGLFSTMPAGVQLAHLYHIPNYWYLSAGINVEAGKRFSGTLATNILSFTANQQYMIQNLEPLVFDVPFDQRSVYFAGNYYLGKGFHVSLAGQFMSCTIPLYRWVDGNAGGSYILGAYSYNDLALNASLTKQSPYLTFTLAADVNRLRDQWYRQAFAGLVFYPAGNVNTYLEIGGTWVTGDQSTGRAIGRLKIGQKLGRRVWLEGDYSRGSIYNYSEQNAYIVYNNLDKIQKRMGINVVMFSILPHLDMSFRYQYTLRTALWQIYENSEYIRDLQQDYPVNSFIGGLTWRF